MMAKWGFEVGCWYVAAQLPRILVTEQSLCSPQATKAMVSWTRYMLDGKRYGPGNRPYWEMEEGQERSRSPNLIRALAEEPDPRQRRTIWERFRKQTDTQIRSGTVPEGVASQ